MTLLGFIVKMWNAIWLVETACTNINRIWNARKLDGIYKGIYNLKHGCVGIGLINA